MTPTRDTRFRQAAWTYLGYGVVYWLGGLVLARSGLGPRGMERGGLAWFIVGALFVVVFPWLLARQRVWVDRWVLSRRDFARILTVLVALRAVEVARIAGSPRTETVSVLGLAVSMSVGAWAFALITGVTAVMLARAAWAREP
ncbi:MAG TPA: hypothetical protein VLD61_10660 [Methylomirabilota bacterium]|nr:hypothetical protein [Methylomirabilota bacterium]